MDREMKFWILISLFVSSVIAANLMGNKIADFGIFQSGVGIMIFPISYLALDVIQEIKGKSTARKILLATLFALVLVTIVTFIATQLPSASRDFFKGGEYNKVFGVSVRVMLASLTAFIIAELSDIELFARIKNWTKQKMLWLRATGSTVLSQFVDTMVFVFLAFYGITPKYDVAFILSIAIPYWILKSIISIFGTPLVYAGVKWVGYDKEDRSGA